MNNRNEYILVLFVFLVFDNKFYWSELVLRIWKYLDVWFLVKEEISWEGLYIIRYIRIYVKRKIIIFWKI